MRTDILELNHISYFAAWNPRDTDYGIPETSVLDLSAYRWEERTDEK